MLLTVPGSGRVDTACRTIIPYAANTPTPPTAALIPYATLSLPAPHSLQ
jgi:hypothetical protein